MFMYQNQYLLCALQNISLFLGRNVRQNREFVYSKYVGAASKPLMRFGNAIKYTLFVFITCRRLRHGIVDCKKGKYD